MCDPSKNTWKVIVNSSSDSGLAGLAQRSKGWAIVNGKSETEHGGRSLLHMHGFLLSLGKCLELLEESKIMA